MADCKIDQLRKKANSKHISCMTLIGVHSTMHLMHYNVHVLPTCKSIAYVHVYTCKVIKEPK